MANQKSPMDEKIVFGLSTKLDGTGLLMIGIPRDAAQYMRDGKTHQIDLTKVGLPLQLVIYGGRDHAACLKVIEDHNKAAGVPYLDERRTDFGIETKPEGENDAGTPVDGSNAAN